MKRTKPQITEQAGLRRVPGLFTYSSIRCAPATHSDALSPGFDIVLDSFV